MACQLVSAKPLFPSTTLNNPKSNIGLNNSPVPNTVFVNELVMLVYTKYVTGTNGMKFYLWNMQYYVYHSKSAAILDLRRISYTGRVHWYQWLGANALEFRLFCIKPSICNMSCTYGSICLDLVDIILLRNVTHSLYDVHLLVKANHAMKFYV